MKLHWSPRSPFVRKVMVVAHEVGVAGSLQCVRTVAATAKENAELMVDNPLSKLPTLVLDNGTALYDSRVICEYLDQLNGGPRLFPVEPPARMLALRRQALADGMLDLLLLWRNEEARPDAHRSQPLLATFAIRREAVLADLEQDVPALEWSAFSIGHIAIGCALAYLDFRFPAAEWRSGRPRLTAWYAAFADRPSARGTAHVDDP